VGLGCPSYRDFNPSMVINPKNWYGDKMPFTVRDLELFFLIDTLRYTNITMGNHHFEWENPL